MASNAGFRVPESNTPSAVDLSSLSHYQVLGLRPGATEGEITKAYRKQALKHHPDKNKAEKSEEWMKKINKAKSVLLSEKRADYDDQLSEEGQVLLDPSGFLYEGKNLKQIVKRMLYLGMSLVETCIL